MSRPLEAELDPGSHQITLTLEGEHARKGVSLDAFDSFISHFLSALRYHYRASRSQTVKKPGHPLAEERLVTAFRLVRFRAGSGIVVLEPPLQDEAEATLPDVDQAVLTSAWANAGDLLKSVGSGGPVDPSVVGELESATRALGRQGRFGIDFRAGADRWTTRVDEAKLVQLRRPQETAVEMPQLITGVLHAIDLEPDKVGIRSAAGVDWSCRYPAELEQTIGRLLGGRVWARGLGGATSARSGSMEVTEIHAVPEFEQTELFTAEPVSLSELMQRQSVERPQGLESLVDPDWEAGVESDLFLAAMLDDAE